MSASAVDAATRDEIAWHELAWFPERRIEGYVNARAVIGGSCPDVPGTDSCLYRSLLRWSSTVLAAGGLR